MRDIVTTLGIPAMVLIALAGCATQRPPEGGPPDSEPPMIVAMEPANETVRFEGREISFEFSEYIQRPSFQEAVHISPLPEIPPTYEWSGRTVRIVFPEMLTENRTYVITVGTKVRDLRAGNAMRESVILAFSTGDSLDRGRFDGTVLTDPPSGVSLFGYLLHDGRADTLDPARHRPEYAVQTAEDGGFHFSNVRPGLYRVFAVRDKNNDFLYNAESEEIGIPEYDVLVGDSSALSPPLRFQLFTEDTTRPSVQRVEALHDHLVRVKFNETIYPQPIPLTRVVIRDSSTGQVLPIRSAVAPESERYAWDFRLASPMTERMFTLWVDTLEDGAGNMVETRLLPLSFVGSTVPDTARPALLDQRPAENSRGVEPDSSFRLVFDRPLQYSGALSLRDSSGGTVDLEIASPEAGVLDVRHPPLHPEAAYTLCMDGSLLRDSLSGRSVGDTIRCIRFTTGVRDQVGSISGQVRSDDTAGIAVVRVRAVGRQPRIRTLRTDATRNFRIDGLPEGQYLLDAFIDGNHNQRHDAGKAFPLQRPEPFGRIRDTIRVRARWETDGIIIPLRSSNGQPDHNNRNSIPPGTPPRSE